MTSSLTSSCARHDAPIARGETNENPRGIPLLALLAEDFRTHDGKWSEPGFWAVALHRLGNARMDVRRKILRAPLSALYAAGFWTIDHIFGIDLSYTVKLGRRVRLWHHGGVVLSARSIGNDVHIRHNTTFGVARKAETWARPIIGDRVDVGVGASILGAVTVGNDCVIGAGAVVVRDVPDGATAVGVPARVVAPVLDRSTSEEVEAPSSSGFRFRAVRVGHS